MSTDDYDTVCPPCPHCERPMTAIGIHALWCSGCGCLRVPVTSTQVLRPAIHAERDRYRAALEEIAEHCKCVLADGTPMISDVRLAHNVARDALAQQRGS